MAWWTGKTVLFLLLNGNKFAPQWHLYI